MLTALARSRTVYRTSVARGARWASQASPPKPPGESANESKEPDTNASANANADVKPEQDSVASEGFAAGKVPSLDFSPAAEAAEEEPKRTGARSAKDDTTLSTEKRRKAVGRAMLALMGAGFAGYAVYMGREWDEEELKAKKLNLATAPSTWWGRTSERFGDIFDYFNKPAWPELLPPPMPPPQGKPYTLVISLDDLLITSTWDRQHGWRTAKRPGVDYFLAYISQFYEVVVFTSQPSYTAAPILEKLDRYNFFITHRLFREGTRYLNGKIVKDLSYLNRDPSKVLVLDTNPDHVCLQPENAVILPKWKGDPKDKGLIAMIPFLESIGIYKPPDIRPILKAYEGKNIPIEYAKTEAEAKARHIEAWKAKQPGVSSGFMASLFGLSQNPHASTSGPPPTYLEQKRKEAQIQYREEQKYLAENKEMLDKLIEQEQQAMAQQVPSNLFEAFGQMGKPPPAPPVPGQQPPSAPGSEQAKA
ncbi:import inner membrane translocase subunit tim-50 [Coprinopsis cinerea okayama7|uniref:Mitochondrial import inner membrane translocase subunit TIM50 n=1 Tax=Coprinopsis cinerea (strain Okayama-7 / 130 / ATCC MYA-4618 / FGSC 9003) TaxID=240176 RepID=A8N4M6_COPC7|nr:import inner membrane translocase subunit tim-50 [Coprinopsis cinerea okayama7\|eukprot:XP_001829795.1 import inner membrane translocase subunit tim-50 [Coprinopsis cinerea okayama7\